MSADNWAICPKCKKANDKENNRRMLEAGEQYGKIPAEAFLKLSKEANVPVELETTLREDYEIGITETGEFYISYAGRCRDCGFEHIVEEEKQLEF